MGLHEALRRASAMSAFTNSQGPGQTPAEAERCWPGLPGSIMALQHMKPRTGVRHSSPNQHTILSSITERSCSIAVAACRRVQGRTAFFTVTSHAVACGVCPSLNSKYAHLCHTAVAPLPAGGSRSATMRQAAGAPWRNASAPSPGTQRPWKRASSCAHSSSRRTVAWCTWRSTGAL